MLGILVCYQIQIVYMIEAKDLRRLAEEFKRKYDRELICKNMGQFNSDFKPINGHDKTPRVFESIFIVKKIYMDKLTDSTGDIGYHIRGKGLTQQSIKTITNEKSNKRSAIIYDEQ